MTKKQSETNHQRAHRSHLADILSHNNIGNDTLRTHCACGAVGLLDLRNIRWETPSCPQPAD
jgi:hypothetical protein